MDVSSSISIAAGMMIIFACGYGCRALTAPVKVVERVERVPYPVYEPRQKRDDKGHWLCKDGSPGKPRSPKPEKLAV